MSMIATRKSLRADDMTSILIGVTSYAISLAVLQNTVEL